MGRAAETEGHVLEALRLSPRDIAAYWWFWFVPGSRGPRRAKIISALVATIAALIVARLLALGLPFRIRPLYTDGIDFRLPKYQPA